ncbi:MAG: gliding motility lipoprotein GldH [Chitinophagales bacterium]|nr:gliding motility lipoprotein GldH [Chitinophagales bacterium]
MALGCVLFYFSACSPSNSWEESYRIDTKTGWIYTDTAHFAFDIADTAALYKLWVELRHNTEYPYANLWIKINTTYPSGEMASQQLDIPLADADGKWLGDGLGSVLQRNLLIQNRAKLPQEGTYTFDIVPYLRENPIPHILDIGLRLEKMTASESEVAQ